MTGHTLRLPVGAALLLGLTFGSGCGLFDEPIDLEVDLESPPVEVNVTEQVNLFEDGLCSDADSESCMILKALDRYDDDAVSDPPRIPEEFPVEITLEDDDGNALPSPDCDDTAPDYPASCDPWVVDVEAWLLEEGLDEEIDIKETVPVDITDELDVSTPDAIQGVTLDEVGLKWIDNNLTFSTVDLDLYMSLEFFEDADADELVESGDVQRIGTIAAQDARTDGITPIEFTDDDAKALFNDGLKKLKFTLVVGIPPGTELALADGAEAGTKLKPLGVTDVALVAKIKYSVTPSELAGDAKDAYDEQGGGNPLDQLPF